MKTIYDKMKDSLEKYPKGRERKNKNRFIAAMLKNKYEESIFTGDLIEAIEKIVVESASLDRAWRQVLEHNEHLRGSDYNDRHLLEQEKIIELGYEPGIRPVQKKIAQITKPYKDDHETDQ